MKENNGREIRELLKRAMPPVLDPELRRDLWPEMLRRLDAQAPRVPWFDWALVVALLLWCLLFPKGIPVLLYHL
jgi:hypothetical protein